MVRKLFTCIYVFITLEMVCANDQYLNDTICFKNLKCFYLGYPWSHVNSEMYFIPNSPKEIDVKIYLTTRWSQGSNRKQIKYVHDEKDIQRKDWTFVVIHGYFSSAFATWVRDAEEALIKKGDYNVLSVDWSKGSGGFNYMQAVANGRVAAAVVARYLRRLITMNLASHNTLHLIGHSIGAHVASYIGVEIPQIAKITGLDPSLPGYGLKENMVRLDPGDAKFVQVIHTNAGVFGHHEPLGHVDFYINGGKQQPGCSFEEIRRKYTTGVIMEYLRCSHSRAQDYFIEAISSTCRFWGRMWNLTGIPDENEKCTVETCQVISLKSNLLPGRGVYYVSTNRNPPYCKNDDVNVLENNPEFFIKK